MKTVKVADKTYEALLRAATSFEDTPDDVIVRLLGEWKSAEGVTGDPAGRRAGPPHRARDFELPLLRVLAEAEGGELTTSDAQDAVGRVLDAELTEADFEKLGRGEVRWRNQVRFARLALKRQGYLDQDAGWGRWRITDKGRRRLARAET